LFLGAPAAPIARVGDPAPAGGVFSYISSYGATLNGSLHVAFYAYTTRDSNSGGMYFFSNGELSRIALRGDPAPEGGTFQSFTSLSLNNNEELAFLGYASSPSPSGIYVFSDGVFRNLVAQGEPAPGGGTFLYIAYFSLNDRSEVGFLSSVTPPGRAGVFLWSGGKPEPIAQTGDIAPGGGTFEFPTLAPQPAYTPSLNADGDVAFCARLSTDSFGVFKFSGGRVTRVAGPGDPAPGGGVIGGASSPSLNDLGQVAFAASVPGRDGVYLSSSGTLSAVAVQGDPAPGGGTLNNVRVSGLNGQTQIGFGGGWLPDPTGVFLATPVK